MGITVTDHGQAYLWLKNKNGVVLRLKSSRQGLGLTTGADGIVIRMD